MRARNSKLWYKMIKFRVLLLKEDAFFMYICAQFIGIFFLFKSYAIDRFFAFQQSRKNPFDRNVSN